MPIVMLGISILAALVILPLIPSIIIYAAFPRTQTTAKGLLGGLKLNARGAFAAYIVVFACLLPFAWRSYNDASANLTWTVTGSVKVLDANNRVVNIAKVPLKVELKPEIVNFAGGKFRATVPALQSKLPMLTFSVGDVGTTVVDLDDPGSGGVDRNDSYRTIALKKDVEIQLIAADQPYSPNGPAPAPVPTGIGKVSP